MLIGAAERGWLIDLIIFADTGGEKPHTYEHVERFNEWCVKNLGCGILIVKKQKTEDSKYGSYQTLEENCLAAKMLPSIAYGFKGCSHKYKREPQDKFCNNWLPAQRWWQQGKKVTKLIGYDATEERRAHIPEDDKYIYRYPLIEWGWGREECIKAIERAGIKSPGKSACFFCPSSKKREIRELRVRYPDLAKRAVEMERNAELSQVKGLGRNFAWADLYEADDRQEDMFAETTVELACDCYDG